MQPSVALVFISALAVRGLLLLSGPWIDPNRAMEPDSQRYLVLADNLRTYHTFGKQQEDGLVHLALAQLREANGTLPARDENGLRPEAFRTPGYPAFIALVRTVHDDVRLLLVVQCILGAFMAVAVLLIARALRIGDWGSLVAGMLWAIHPGLALHDTLILSENLFNVLTLTGLLVAGRSRLVGGAALAGGLIGAAALVRPLGLLYLPTGMVLIALYSNRRALALVAIASLAVAPSFGWAIRNHQAGEGFRVSTVSELNLLFYVAGYSISEERGEDWLQAFPTRVRELSSSLSQRIGPGDDVIAAARRLALEQIAARPWAAFRVEMKSVVKLALDHSAGTAAKVLGLSYTPSGMFSRVVLNHSNASAGGNADALLAAAAWSGLNAAIVLGAFCGVVQALWRRNWNLVIGCGMTAMLFTIATGSVGLERFRMPMMFPLIVLAANMMRLQGFEVADRSRWNMRVLARRLKGHLRWRRQVWRRYWFLLRTFRNGFVMIQHYRRRTPCARAVCWDGTILQHPAERTGLIETILEVWCDQTYTGPFYRPAPGDVIIDAGANIGLFSVWMARKYPGCRVLAFEPFGENFTLLEQNASASRAVLEARLGALGGATARGHMTDGGSRSLDHRLTLEDRGQREPALPVYSFSDVLHMANAERIALFKIDIEGSEYDLIAQADPQDLNRVSRFAIEYHDNLRAGTLKLLHSRLSPTHRIDVHPAGAGSYGMLYATHREGCAT